MANLAPDPAKTAEATDDGCGRLDEDVLQRRWRLVLPHREQLLRIARRRVPSREDAEDVVATAMVRTVEHPRLDESRVGAFLCTTVVRLAVDVHRDRARQLAVGVRDATRALPHTPIEDTVCDSAEARWLAALLSDLPVREREVLAARVAGLSAQEVAAHLGLTAKSTENAFTRVRRRAHGLVAATLGGVGFAVAHGRRAARPALAAVPVAAITALGLAVVTVATAPPGAEQAVPFAAGAVGATAPRAPLAPVSVVRPATPAARPAPSPAVVAARVPVRPAVRPAPARTEIRVPTVVDKDVVSPGGVAIERRHEDESFRESVLRCVRDLDVSQPLADPCD